MCGLEIPNPPGKNKKHDTSQVDPYDIVAFPPGEVPGDEVAHGVREGFWV